MRGMTPYSNGIDPRGPAVGSSDLNFVARQSSAENTLYFVENVSSTSALYRTATLTGTPSSPVFALNPFKVRTGGAWQQPSGDILPQTCAGTAGVDCPASPRFLDSGEVGGPIEPGLPQQQDLLFPDGGAAGIGSADPYSRTVDRVRCRYRRLFRWRPDRGRGGD